MNLASFRFLTRFHRFTLSVSYFMIRKAMYRPWLSGRVEFAQAVRPENYKLFQLADLICSVKLLELKLSIGMPMTARENKFFGGPRNFKRNTLKQLKVKELP